MQLVSIDGQATLGWNGDQAAQLLRGRTGSSVSVKLARRSQAVPGVPARPEPPLPKLEYKQVRPLTVSYWCVCVTHTCRYTCAGPQPKLLQQC